MGHSGKSTFQRAGLLIGFGLIFIGDVPSGVRAEDTTAKMTATTRLSLDNLSATRERPLFTPNRRPPDPAPVAIAPPPPPPPPPTAQTPPPSVMFFGTFESNSEIAATIQVAPNDKPLIVHYGSYVNGWRVVEITRHHLVLALNDHTIEFSLFAPRAGRDAANTSPTEQQSPFPPGLPAPPYR